jgi:adenosylcobinamide-GDP ribazoletransferase
VSTRAHGFRAGVSFLTRLPVGRTVGEEDVAASIGWFPVVGALVGALAGVVYIGASELWPPFVSALLAVGAGVAVTGAFHEDGLADTADAFGAASTGRDPHPAMKDPRVGAFGVVALVLGLGVRVAAVASLTPRVGLLALIAAGALARGISAIVVVTGRSAEEGLGAGYARLASRRRGVVALGSGAVIATVSLGMTGLLAVGLAWLAAVAIARWATRVLGAVTGDVLGAIEQTGEVVALLVTVAAVARGAAIPLG